ncbi:MAG: cell division protein FtsZ [Alphaproteobacteria bacterium]|nr:cell division protein FtsZ [Alphaproteobacteria bacterium]
MAETKPIEVTSSLQIGLATPPPEVLLTPNIGVIGVGGAGGNAINNMIASNLTGVSFFSANTDAQALSKSLCSEKIQLGVKETRGLGAGADPNKGKASAEESADKIKEEITGLDLLFLTAGMGGGTGTGALPVIAQMAHEMGIMTVAVVSTPFSFEGPARMRTAKAGIEEVKKYVDTMMVVPNQNLFRVATETTVFEDAFKMADDVLCQGVRSITDLIMNPGMVNLDFADLTTVLKSMGRAMIGYGVASGENRANVAVEKALSNPLLDDNSMRGARSVLFNICSAPRGLTLVENDIISQRIIAEADPNANIIWGTSFDETMGDSIRVSVVATGLQPNTQQQEPVPGPRVQTTTEITPPQNLNQGVTMPQPEQPEVHEEPEAETLLPPGSIQILPINMPMAAAPDEDLVVVANEDSAPTQDTLLADTPAPIIQPLQDIPQPLQSADQIDLEQKTNESNVKPVKTSLFDRMPIGWNLRSTRKKQALKKEKEKEDVAPELDFKSIPSFLK